MDNLKLEKTLKLETFLYLVTFDKKNSNAISYTQVGDVIRRHFDVKMTTKMTSACYWDI